ncbi:27-O-demethylrifamycin SV methyltransferase [Colletotrichum orbiculare MAFF 240422]|uniref:27-O-demethylrifamycin SV methyltransferase n=1 Tax=Colletotrichum orbiculare (strain 104-T / ATCC 96160 / CBS 514.97 / LARS 414 / MAFF 240422) TaxID=1213857 RepID=A0A484FYB3_COLOR|nr:27-O-demethylrifamycin SV methyltransferase [Colletotrichum orbiculare MAFF 240422]
MAVHDVSGVPEDLKARVKESYDTMAPVYNTWTVQQSSLRLDYLEKLMEKLLSAKPLAGQKLLALELGCGCGLPVTDRLLATPDVFVTANDLSSAQIQLARENLAKHGADCVSFVEGDMMALEFAENSFDAVLAMYSVIHLPREEQSEMIRRIARWLKPGGFLLANFSTEEMPGHVNDQWLHEKGWMYWSGWGTEATVKKIEDTGLELVVKDDVKDETDDTFLWILAKK